MGSYTAAAGAGCMAAPPPACIGRELSNDDDVGNEVTSMFDAKTMSAAELRGRAREVAEKALGTLLDLLDCEHPPVRLKAAETLLQRGYGRAAAAAEDGGMQDIARLPLAEKLRIAEERRAQYDEWITSMRTQLANETAVQIERK
jgi:hypothetical protein